MEQFDICVRRTIEGEKLVNTVDYSNLMCEIYEIDKRCKAFNKVVQPGCLNTTVSEFFKAVQGNRSEL